MCTKKGYRKKKGIRTKINKASHFQFKMAYFQKLYARLKAFKIN